MGGGDEDVGHEGVESVEPARRPLVERKPDRRAACPDEKHITASINAFYRAGHLECHGCPALGPAIGHSPDDTFCSVSNEHLVIEVVPVVRERKRTNQALDGTQVGQPEEHGKGGQHLSVFAQREVSAESSVGDALPVAAHHHEPDPCSPSEDAPQREDAAHLGAVDGNGVEDLPGGETAHHHPAGVGEQRRVLPAIEEGSRPCPQRFSVERVDHHYAVGVGHEQPRFVGGIVEVDRPFRRTGPRRLSGPLWGPSAQGVADPSHQHAGAWGEDAALHRREQDGCDGGPAEVGPHRLEHHSRPHGLYREAGDFQLHVGFRQIGNTLGDLRQGLVDDGAPRFGGRTMGREPRRFGGKPSLLAQNVALHPMDLGGLGLQGNRDGGGHQALEPIAMIFAAVATDLRFGKIAAAYAAGLEHWGRNVTPRVAGEPSRGRRRSVESRREPVDKPEAQAFPAHGSARYYFNLTPDGDAAPPPRSPSPRPTPAVPRRAHARAIR